MSTLWPRFLPLLFGLVGVGLWLLCVDEYYELRQDQPIACIVASGLLVANAYVLYYCFELKQYSAEFCFSGILMTLFQTTRLSERQRLVFLAIASLFSLLFTYVGLFMIGALALAVVFDRSERSAWSRHLPILVSSLITAGVLLTFLYFTDYRYGETPRSGGVLHHYWATSFVQGGKFVQKAESLKKLYAYFLTDWWRTEYGWLWETPAIHTKWYVWPLRTLKNPDIRHTLFWLSLIVMGTKLSGHRLERDPLYLGTWMIFVAAGMAITHVYPWGSGRLALYLLPVSAMLVTESVRVAIQWIGRLPRLLDYAQILWLPFLWLILRNSVFCFFLLSVAPLRENLRDVVPYLNPSVPYIIVSRNSDVILNTFSEFPPQMRVLYESQGEIKTIIGKIGRSSAYYLWVHSAPPRDAQGNLMDYREAFKEEKIISDPDRSIGLSRLKPL